MATDRTKTCDVGIGATRATSVCDGPAELPLPVILVAWRRCRSTGWSWRASSTALAHRCCSSTAFTADALAPLAAEPVLQAGYRRILCHRRGYGDSTAADGQGSISRDAAHAAALLDVLGLDRVHIVGLSFSGAIALQFALSAPARVHSLTVIEPPPLQGAAGRRVPPANAQQVAVRQAAGVAVGLGQVHDAADGRTVADGAGGQAARCGGLDGRTPSPSSTSTYQPYWHGNSPPPMPLGCQRPCSMSAGVPAVHGSTKCRTSRCADSGIPPPFRCG